MRWRLCLMSSAWREWFQALRLSAADGPRASRQARDELKCAMLLGAERAQRNSWGRLRPCSSAREAKRSQSHFNSTPGGYADASSDVFSCVSCSVPAYLRANH